MKHHVSIHTTAAHLWMDVQINFMSAMKCMNVSFIHTHARTQTPTHMRIPPHTHTQIQIRQKNGRLYDRPSDRGEI